MLERFSMVPLAALTLATSALVGCGKETVSSENIRTAGIAALITATATSSSSSTVHVDLKVGGDESNTFVILESGDELYAEADGDRKTMREVDDGEYEADFDTGAAGTVFVVSLEREVDDDAPDSRGTIPDPFTISSPSSGDEFSRATDSVTIDWGSGSSDDMDIEWNGNCVFIDSASPSDSGSYTIDELDTTSGDEDETCSVEVELTRERNGSTDSAFDSESYFRLQQVRSTSFRSAP